ncbi:unnamed protein product [Lactuca saligna]|uniref:ABC transmembrane type-1 domain-containing protein n=1 Tax=Lactuca saligna TaxID=75948 RepID=A0AA35V3H4_LACSI|nr:unnamed protein product [Lactuca saligna]CAI9293984.1 unnamed protein product [Lactuca saligna]
MARLQHKPISSVIFGDYVSLVDGFGISRFILSLSYVQGIHYLTSSRPTGAYIHDRPTSPPLYPNPFRTSDSSFSLRFETPLSSEIGGSKVNFVIFKIISLELKVDDQKSKVVGNFIHYLLRFLAELVVGFVSAWKLALYTVAVIPGIAFAGGLYAYTLTCLTSKSLESYATVGIIAEQAIAQVRTVYSYVGKTKALDSYSDAI